MPTCILVLLFTPFSHLGWTEKDNQHMKFTTKARCVTDIHVHNNSEVNIILHNLSVVEF